jgi:hypothetical protein
MPRTPRPERGQERGGKNGNEGREERKGREGKGREGRKETGLNPHNVIDRSAPLKVSESGTDKVGMTHFLLLSFPALISLYALPSLPLMILPF